AAAYHRVAVVVVTAAVRARAHREHPARLGHLVVDLAQRGRHLVAQRAGHDHQVALAWAGTEQHAEAVDVVARRTGVHHLDRAARQTEGHRPQRSGLRPVDQRIDAGRDEAFLEYTLNAHIVLLPVEGALFPFVREADD